jgi:hypothetical protein
VQAIFESKKVSKLRSVELLEALHPDPELAWVTYNRGQPLTVRQLAKLLAGYGIKPRTVRLDKHRTYKGYYAADFDDAFSRYLTPENDPDLRHIAPEALPTLTVGVSDAKRGIRNVPDDPDLATQALIDTFEAEVAGTAGSSPPLGSSGDSDVSGKGRDHEAF